MKVISIITICYNDPNLEKTCQNIVNQTWQDFEWIVVDGGSNKETLDIFEKYKNRIDKFVSEPDNGIYNACNKGIKMAEGKYVIFMNAGDKFFNEDVLKAVSALLETTDADVVYGDNECLFKNSDINPISHQPQTITADFLITKNLCTQSVFIKKEIFDIYGGFDEKYKIASDYHKWVQLFKARRSFKYIPIIVSSYDMYGISCNSDSLLKKERYEIQTELLSQEVYDFERNTKEKYSFLENIFSLKNSSSGYNKIITFLGIHIKKRRKF